MSNEQIEYDSMPISLAQAYAYLDPALARPNETDISRLQLVIWLAESALRSAAYTDQEALRIRRAAIRADLLTKAAELRRQIGQKLDGADA